MADKLGDLMGRFGKGPSGLGLGVKLLIAAGGLGYAATQSVYTGTLECVYFSHQLVFAYVDFFFCSLIITVEGGHRAIIFSRLGGIQKNVYSEGLHFR